MVEIIKTPDNSYLRQKGITKGAKIIAINSHKIRDALDFQFHSATHKTSQTVEILDKHSHKRTLSLDTSEFSPTQIEVAPLSLKRCPNQCIFCFIDQQPEGMRDSLYIKDEDYRYSFIHGNYITLTNLSDEDYQRIKYQNLSPLYISVHTTDDNLRRRILGNPQAPPILPSIRRLTDGGIKLHTQIVLMPGINDGKVLWKTIDDLAELQPQVASIGIVPVGLTKYRDDLPTLERVTSSKARDLITKLKGSGTEYGFLHLADEFYIRANHCVPPDEYYKNFPQIENGIGMVRNFLSEWDELVDSSLQLSNQNKISIITGRDFYPYLKACLKTLQSKSPLEVWPIDSQFWGDTVTVTGLLTGKDIYHTLKDKELGEAVVIPDECINYEGLFLDDWDCKKLHQKLDTKIIPVPSNPSGFIRYLKKLSR